jgi:4-diphosphocytidyl-2-C-methyl-D-erythritol kinase
VAKRHPEIRRIVADLTRAGAECAAMSGSGSAVFGLFGSRAGAERAARALGRPSRRTLVTRTVARAEYGRLAAN